MLCDVCEPALEIDYQEHVHVMHLPGLPKFTYHGWWNASANRPHDHLKKDNPFFWQTLDQWREHQAAAMHMLKPGGAQQLLGVGHQCRAGGSDIEAFDGTS